MNNTGLPPQASLPPLSAIQWESFPYVHHAVVTFIRQTAPDPARNQLLLIVKKRGLGAGKINAPGGKIEAGETPLQAAVRETREEVGLTPSGLVHACHLHFLFRDGYSLRGHVFLADGFSGTIIETEEAKPFWCLESEIPYEKMWEDDRLWLPHLLQGKTAEGFFTFDGDRMVEQKLIVHP